MVEKINSALNRKNSSISTPAFIGIVIAVCLLLGVLAYSLFAPHSDRVAARPLTQNDQWIKQKAAESGGDINKLSMQDQRKLIMLKGDQGPMELRHYAEAAK